MTVTILIFEPSDCRFGHLRRQFREEVPDDWDVRLVSTRAELLRLLEEDDQEYLVVLPDRTDDAASPDAELVGTLRQLRSDLPIILTADQGNVDSVARAIRAGATDFLVMGKRLRERIATLLGKLGPLLDMIARNRLLDEHNAQLRESILAQWEIVGRSPRIRALVEQIRRVAEVPRPVLIAGERGTGKELVARAIHFASGDSSRPIVTVNCAAFGDALLESELFGHEKGAFTGADSSRHGKFEQADSGTLFLDEIGNMSLSFQEKILRVVEYGTFTRVGGMVERTSSARIISATNRDLKQRIAANQFLPDLYDRLAFETLHVPPLRERSGDIELLAHYFLDQFARETPVFDGKVFSREALAALRSYCFPGNVRELKNLVERAAFRDTTNEITPGDLGLAHQPNGASADGSFSEKMHAFGRRLIEGALRESEGNQAQAARTLGLSYHQFRYYRMKYLLTVR